MQPHKKGDICLYMIYTDLTKKAMKICFDVHKDQVDKSGLPYAFHPFHLAEIMDDEYSVCVALLHDTVEDSNNPETIKSKISKEFPKEVFSAILHLTHQKGIPYMEYIEKIKTDPLATKVKIADLKHNSDLSRLDIVTEKDEKRAEKYLKAINYLLNKTEE